MDTNHGLTISDINLLLPLLTEIQQKIIFFRGHNGSVANILKELSIDRPTLRKETSLIQRTIKRCRELCNPISILKDSLLYAPIDILNLSTNSYHVLRRKRLDLIANFYQLKVTKELLLTFRGIGKNSAVEIINAPKKVGLPPLAESLADLEGQRKSQETAIYYWFDEEKRSFLTDRQKYLLEKYEWGRVDKNVAYKACGLLATGQIKGPVNVGKSILTNHRQ